MAGRIALFFPVVLVGATALAGCGSSSARCLTSDVGEVCADGSGGSVEFSGSGLEPGSDVTVNHPELGDSIFTADADGSFEPGGRGFLSFVSGVDSVFTISAIDSEGTPIDGTIVVTS